VRRVRPYGWGAEVKMWEQTPWQKHHGVWVKRDDLFRVGRTNGGKARTCIWVASSKRTRGVVSAGLRGSSQLTVVSGVARAAGVPCQLHVPAGEDTPEILAAQEAGADLVRHRPGYGSVVAARARWAAEELGWALIPYRMETGDAVICTASQVQRIVWPKINRLVVPVGSGMSLSGILAGMEREEIDCPVIGVVAGVDPTKTLDKYAPGWQARVKLVEGAGGYHHLERGMLGSVDLDPAYEAKCLEYVQPGDGLWVVGRGVKQ
jgi:1-aminocyclopropane-1-carboxylate deaminase/D-cysteine desulfhydrase-like pyridoxal-dependent ACC family enzyme